MTFGGLFVISSADDEILLTCPNRLRFPLRI
jgi:hypothetical protein